jgi:hypothetical protein
MEGLKQLVSDREHRQELVANGLGHYLSRRNFSTPIAMMGSFTIMLLLLDFLELSDRLGSSAGEFWSHFLIYQRKMNHTIYLMKWFAGELPEVKVRPNIYVYIFNCLLQIAFILIVSRKPVNFPMALAAFTLIQSAAKNLRLNLNSIFQQTGDFASQLSSLRAIYAVSEIENKVQDGTESLNTNRDGLSLEFELVIAPAPWSTSS